MRLWKQSLDQVRAFQTASSTLNRTNRGLASTVAQSFCKASTSRVSGFPFSHQTVANDQHQFVSVRCYSSTNPVANKSEDEEMSFIQRIQASTLSTIMSPRTQFYALVAGGTVGAYGLSRVVLSFTSFFTHLTPTTIAKWGFYAGFGTASGTSTPIEAACFVLGFV